MNYLSHHTVALDRYGENQPPEFYVGNVLPDLVGTSGVGRLRLRMLPDETSGDDALLRGVRLHWETDRRFHGLPAFAQTQEEAKRLLRDTPFETPPRRTFFLAHAAVEIALDGLLLQQHPKLAHDFYGQFAAADLDAIVAQTRTLFFPDTPLFALTRTIERFVGSRYLLEYTTAEGQAEALFHLSERAGIVANFATDADRRRLAAFFDRLADAVRPHSEALLLRSEAETPVVK